MNCWTFTRPLAALVPQPATSITTAPSCHSLATWAATCAFPLEALKAISGAHTELVAPQFGSRRNREHMRTAMRIQSWKKLGAQSRIVSASGRCVNTDPTLTKLAHWRCKMADLDPTTHTSTTQTRRHRGDGRIFLRGNTLWCGFSVDGIEHRESTKTNDPIKA